MWYSWSWRNCKIFSFHIHTSQSPCVYVTGHFPFKKRKSKLDCKIVCNNSTQGKKIANKSSKKYSVVGQKRATIKSLLSNVHQKRRTRTMDGHREQQEISASFWCKFYISSSDYISFLQPKNLKRRKSKWCNTCIKTAVCVFCNSRK